MKICTINNFEIRVDPSWLIIAGLVTWSLSQGYFPDALPGRTGSVYLVMAVVAMLGLFASLLLHELAHSVVARRLGVPIKTITLFLFGGVAELEAEPKSARTEFWIAIAGPVMSAGLGVGFWTLSLIVAFGGAAAASVAVLSYLALVNIVLALFNLVPAFPLDGGRILRAYLWHRTGDALAATKAASRSGAFFGYLLMALGVLALFQGNVLAGIWYVLIGAFVLVAARSSYAMQRAQAAFEGTSVAALMCRTPVTVSPQVTLSELLHQVFLPRNISFAPVMEDGVLLGHIDRSVLSRIDQENWVTTRVGDVFVGLNDQVMIGPDVGIDALFETIRKTNRRKILVVQDHHLLGVITLSDLTRHLSLTPLSPSSGPRTS
ncbi:site-2 protease family protein [uncultured Sulfitobacter sp.]|uniref:site-2 protease family protein n=1 Tax=uncultured Sulfitobacter sp. TaxID=191468 RepID=UPI00262D7248|nr:site-2 protease family protein [uncultured Sulfitobacter sp.]